MKSKDKAFNIGTTSKNGTPILMKKLEGDVMGEANNDGTIFVDPSVPKSQRDKVIAHEEIHIQQMKQGRLQYSDDSVTWKKDAKSPTRVYKRSTMNEGGKNLEWEKEAYNKSKT
jgi:hypothetical protein